MTFSPTVGKFPARPPTANPSPPFPTSASPRPRSGQRNGKRLQDKSIKGPKDTGPKKNNQQHMAYAKKVRDDPCNKAARCMLVPWGKSKRCPPRTPHHLVFKASFKDSGGLRPGCKSYNAGKAPCICATGGASAGAHGLIHAKQKDQMVRRLGGRLPQSSDTWKCGRAERVAAKAANELFPQCSRGCIRAQLRSVHPKMEVNEGAEMGMVTAGASQDSLQPLLKAFRS
jgi:hypothetical protein